MHPASEVGGEQDRIGVAVHPAGDPENELSLVADLPVHLPVFPAIGEHEGIQPAVESFDPHPGRKGHRLIVARDAEADAVGDAFELERSLTRPAALGPLGSDDGPARRQPGSAVRGPVFEGTVPRILFFEIEMDERGGILSQILAGPLPRRISRAPIVARQLEQLLPVDKGLAATFDRRHFASRRPHRGTCFEMAQLASVG